MREEDKAVWKEREQIQAMLSRHFSTEKGRKVGPPEEERPVQGSLRPGRAKPGLTRRQEPTLKGISLGEPSELEIKRGEGQPSTWTG